jgi:hypothetical protein
MQWALFLIPFGVGRCFLRGGPYSRFACCWALTNAVLWFPLAVVCGRECTVMTPWRMLTQLLIYA